MFENSLARTAEAVKITRDNPKFMMAHMAGKVNMGDMFETNGVASIHFSMFLNFLKTNANAEQKKLCEFLSRPVVLFAFFLSFLPACLSFPPVVPTIP
jgi:hypothetical protein